MFTSKFADNGQCRCTIRCNKDEYDGNWYSNSSFLFKLARAVGYK